MTFVDSAVLFALALCHLFVLWALIDINTTLRSIRDVLRGIRDR